MVQVTVNLKDLDKVCRCCAKVKDDVRDRTYYGKGYEGPCGDSFCYASCDLSACKPIRNKVCNDCEYSRKIPPK